MSRPKSIILIESSYLELSESFFDYQEKLGYVVQTCRTRQLHVEAFLSWLERSGQVKIKQVKANDIQRYYEYLKSLPSKQGLGLLSEKYIVSQLWAIDQLFDLLKMEGRIQVHPLRDLFFSCDWTSAPREILNKEETQSLYAVCKSTLERSILSLCYGCGLRAGELENLNIEDVRLKDKILIVEKGKGNKRRVIPLSGGVMKDLSSYIEQERAVEVEKNEFAFLLNKNGTRLRAYTANKYLKKLIERTKDKNLKKKKISLHSLRHSIATHLLEAGVNVVQVRQFLGHSQLETTQLYTRVNQDQLKELLN